MIQLTRYQVSVTSLLALSLASVPAALPAQLLPDVVHVSVGAAEGVGRASVAGLRRARVGGERAAVLVGLRATAYGGAVRSFSNREEPVGALAPQLEIDPAAYGLNLMVGGELAPAGPLLVGFNLDLVGLVAGPARGSGTVDSKPANVSLFRYGNRDLGSLNSEFYVSLVIAPRLWMRLGASHYVVGYRATDNGSAGSPTRRYQRFETVPFVAIDIRR